MSAPRPCETNPLRQPSSVHVLHIINFCIYVKDFYSFHPYGNYIASWYDVDLNLSFTHALFRNHLLRSQPFGGHEK